jgi:Reverse transcriptase (RNA-dependent DNA polymerase)
MEQVFQGLQNILIYIDDVLIHTDTHEKHLKALEQVLMRLYQHHLKINLDKCLFGDKRVSYLGFTLTPEGIKPGEAKLKTIKSAAPPGDVKAIWSFVGLCNFFWNHIQGLRNHGSTIVQADKARFRIPVRASTQSSSTSLPSAPDPTVQAASTGLSEIRSELSVDNKCLHTGSRPSRGTVHNLGPEGRTGPGQNHITCLQATQGKREKLHQILTRNGCCRLGHGQLQRIPKGFEIHLVQGSNHGTKSGHDTS